MDLEPRADGVQQPESEGFQEMIGDVRTLMAAMSSQTRSVDRPKTAITVSGQCPIKGLFGYTDNWFVRGRPQVR